MSTSVNSTTSTTSSLSAKTGMAGLISGLDTDTLVENLTSSSRSKIAKQQQSVQKMEWKQTAYRNVSKALKEFQSKYLDVLSTTNFRSASAFNTVAASTTSTKLSVASTSAANTGSITITNVTQLATNQTITGTNGATTPLTGTAAADISGLLSDITNGSKSFLLKLDGQVRTITLDADFVTAAGTNGVDFQTALQDKIDSAFGEKSGGGSVVDVSLVDGKLGFSASGSQLTVNALNSDSATLTKLGLTDGQTDRLDTYKTLADLSLATSATAVDGEFKFSINGKAFSFKTTDSLSSVMSKVNSSDAGVTMSYSSITDKFTLTSTKSGAGENIVVTDNEANGLMKAFGLAGVEGVDKVTTAGQNAELTVNGQAIVRTSNSIEVDGVKIDLLATTDTDEELKISMKTDASSLKDTIKNFVEDYNTMIDLMNGLVKENVDSDYPPLTEQQKGDMTEKQIEAWEAKAKVGLLKGDNVLKGITSKMQSLMYSSATSGGISLYNMGISSAGYTENGKLKIDDEKLVTALETKGAEIKELFSTDTTGLGDRLNDIINGAVKTSGVKGTRGSLIELAGYESTLSNTENSITSSITKTNKSITKLKAELKSQESYYWNKFSALETALQQLNSQSAMITSFGASS
ncbi:flagellar filament capping protein FliD [Acetobacterium woodii]|uniref:Flagellar hook-associated protein 2 n=1 Tax=Acetobacterium woodii (strain ATCC 29683 / DSM 1030 / JCM 2381 / KCTC 1655 / WB1) TaxID=931626 RepID=H6LDR0_ACEWD|nr:flagellar filament capping protein FliD [Acetobacterium woodii]AFA49224.1 flagellar capping protein FliD [Acetobacterium woodii DSM 1030]